MKKVLNIRYQILLCMLIGLVAILLPNFNVNATESVAGESGKVTIHYHRYDTQYDGWNLWVWPEGGEGVVYPVEKEDDFGSSVTIDISKMDTTKLGVIIRLNDWEARDVDIDRFIDLSKLNSGQLDVYFVQGDPEVYYDKNEIDLSPKFLSAKFPTNKEIAFMVTVPIDTSLDSEKDKYKVLDETGKVYPIKKIWSMDGGMTSLASVILEEPLDFEHTYTLERVDYGSILITMGDAFSTPEFETAYTYMGDDLGANYTKSQTTFKVWAPTANNVQCNLYKEGTGDNLVKSLDMKRSGNGTWIYEEKGDLSKFYYTYSVTVGGVMQEAVDPYAKGVGVNGLRGMVIDLENTNPEGWNSDKKPEFKAMTDAIVYEMHIRDVSSDSTSGIKNTGKFLGLAETGTKNPEGLSTGLDHIKELGVTHLHLLPAFDYVSVDETKLDEPQFNWGYDPENYNVPEGSYATNPEDGEVRVKEFKQMVKTLHENDIRVVMDVVYNHTAATVDSNFNKIVPDYYYRKNDDTFSNASGCGNETASDRSMMRKFIVDSVVYWATEYHIDGFRFDLMGIHDIDTMNAVRTALDAVDPTILVYGEGWAAGDSPYPEGQRALKANMRFISNVAAFNDDIRDGVKGSVFDKLDRGFVSGKQEMEDTIKFGIVGATDHQAVEKEYWADTPSQSINYVSAHDNLTLWDKLASSNPEDSLEDRIKMNKLASAIVLTSQGIPFFQAGEEILRTKPSKEGEPYDENSYRSPDEVNSIKWSEKSENIEVYNYYKGLIAFRKAHSGLRMTTTEEIQKNLTFIEGLPDNVIAYTIDNRPNNETSERLLMIFNANRESVDITIPDGQWNVYINGASAGVSVLDTIDGGTVKIEPISCFVLAQNQENTEKLANTEAVISSKKANYMPMLICIVSIVVILVVGFVSMKKKRK